jgi:poly(A) polymerase
MAVVLAPIRCGMVLIRSPIIHTVYNLAQKRRDEVYLVGGAVRDFLMERPFGKDFDFVLPGKVAGLAEALAGEMGGRAFLLDKDLESWRVVIKKGGGKSEVDFCALQGGDIAADLRQRDFTINSMAYRLQELFQGGTPSLLDPLRGLSDLRKGILRADSEESLRQDPLRMLRAFRFACTLGMTIEGETMGMIRRNSGLIRKSAGERVRSEFFAALHENQAGPFLRDLDQTGLLREVFPEIAEWEQLGLGPHYDFPLLEHAFRTVEAGEFLLVHLRLFSPPYAPLLEQHFDQLLEEGISRKALFKFGCFFHDSGKPKTRSQSLDPAPIRFLDHDQEGQKTNALIAHRLKLSRKSSRILSEWTRQHMRIQSLGKTESITSRAKYRFFRDLGQEGLDLVFLAIADTLGSRRFSLQVNLFSDPPDGVRRIREVGGEILHYYFEEYSPKPPGLLLNGKEIMKTLNLHQSSQVGRLLGRLREAEINGEIRSREEALEFIKNIDISKPLS